MYLILTLMFKNIRNFNYELLKWCLVVYAVAVDWLSH